MATRLFWLAYNLPICVIFAVVAGTMLQRLLRMGPARFARADGGAVVAWTFGAIALYLRLVAPAIAASGHLVWLPMLTLQARHYHLPRWFVWGAAGFTLICLVLKFTVMSVRSGVEGIAIGLPLAALVWFTHQRPK